jgi:ATP-dependent metalloprotease FtsH
MQQAVTTSQVVTLTPASLIVSILNRNLIRLKFDQLIEFVSKHLQERLSNLNASSDDAGLVVSNLQAKEEVDLKNKSNVKTLNNAHLNNSSETIDCLLSKIAQEVAARHAAGECLIAVDPIIEPLVVAGKNQTFFENKFGFSEKELFTENCEYRPSSYPTISSSSRRNILFNKLKLGGSGGPVNIYYQRQQTRGFKTKRTTSNESDTANPWHLFNLKSLLTNEKASSDEAASLKSLLAKASGGSSSSSSSSKSLGSIFDKSPRASSSSSFDSKSSSDLDDKVKVAFAEGLLYKYEKEKKKANLAKTIWSLFLFSVLTYFFFTTFVSISTGSNGNGKSNSSQGGGINLRSLTGNVNFEVNPETVSVKFDDVKGMPEAKKELVEIVDFLKDPEKYTKLGARLPKGVLLVGPPGCGKTLIAKAVAGEAGVPFFQASGSDFDEMFVGTGSKRVRQLFSAARARAPCVIFIDEIDSVGSKRTNSMIHPHANQTINQLLAEMDGFQKNEGVIVLGATNRRDTLDSALMRPGRFDVEVRIDKPDLSARIEILEYYLDKVARDENIDVKYLARQLTGLGGSTIENVVNQAALRAVVSNSKTVKMEHLEFALDRALMGYGKSRLMDEECNRNTAFHEAGHVLVAYYTKDSDPLHKVTILPRCIWVLSFFLRFLNSRSQISE